MEKPARENGYIFMQAHIGIFEQGGMDMGEERQMPHKLVLNERKLLTITGVTEVISFDEGAVLLHTGLGTLVIQGRELQLKALTPENGQVAVEGMVSALAYEETGKRGGWVKRLFG